MDLSIHLITPGYWQGRGAEAFDQGLGIDDHDLNPGVRAIVDWQLGYRQREREREVQEDRAWAVRELAEACPP
jgi:hypothetical protein